MTLELHIQPPGPEAFARMLSSHPYLGLASGEIEVRFLPHFIWVPVERDCWQCGQPTTWIDLDFEAALHPGPCSERAWDEYRWAEMLASWEEHKEHWIRLAGESEDRQEPPG